MNTKIPITPEEREEIALFAQWCIGSVWDDFDPRVEAEREKVMTDDQACLVWREGWLEYHKNRRAGIAIQKIEATPVPPG
jgi:hypothetical protein